LPSSCNQSLSFGSYKLAARPGFALDCSGNKKENKAMFTRTPEDKLTWGQFEAERKLPKDHFLMRINELIDFSPIEKALRELYSEDKGRPAYPPLVLFKICLLQRFYNLSDVQVVEQIRYNFLFMRFVGRTLSDDPPDDTTIVRFRDRIEDKRILSNGLAFINQQLEGMGLKRGLWGQGL